MDTTKVIFTCGVIVLIIALGIFTFRKVFTKVSIHTSIITVDSDKALRDVSKSLNKEFEVIDKQESKNNTYYVLINANKGQGIQVGKVEHNGNNVIVKYKFFNNDKIKNKNHFVYKLESNRDLNIKVIRE